MKKLLIVLIGGASFLQVAHAQFTVAGTYSSSGGIIHNPAGSYLDLLSWETSADSTGVSSATEDSDETFGAQVVFTGSSSGEPTATGSLSITVYNAASASAKNTHGGTASSSGDAYGTMKSASAPPTQGSATSSPYPSNTYYIYGNGLNFTYNSVTGYWTAVESFVTQALDSSATTTTPYTDKDGGVGSAYAYYTLITQNSFNVTGS